MKYASTKTAQVDYSTFSIKDSTSRIFDILCYRQHQEERINMYLLYSMELWNVHILLILK